MTLLQQLTDQLAEISWQRQQLAKQYTFIREAMTQLRVGMPEDVVRERLRRNLEKEQAWQQEQKAAQDAS